MDEVDPTKACEDVLREIMREYEKADIYPKLVAVGHRMLARQGELSDAYAEIREKLRFRPRAVRVFLDMLLGAAAYWNPQKITEARRGREQIRYINSRIAEVALELATLLGEREELYNSTRFTSDTHYDVIDVIEKAAANKQLFNSYVRERILALRDQYDDKYWPTLSDFVHELALDADDAELYAPDPVTSAATTGTRGSLADFFKALFAAIRRHMSDSACELLPGDFTLTDDALASFANCALGLGPDNLVDGPYVKRLRQRERKREGQVLEEDYAPGADA